MANTTPPVNPPPNSTEPDFGHPKGTLAIVIVFGALFALGWLAMFVWGFLSRGALHS